MGEMTQDEAQSTDDPCESVYRSWHCGAWTIRHLGQVRLYRYLPEGDRPIALCGWHVGMYGDLVAPIPAPRKLRADEAGAVNALTKVHEVLAGWIEGARDNADANGRPLSPGAFPTFDLSDFRMMLVDAARELDVLDAYRREIGVLDVYRRESGASS